MEHKRRRLSLAHGACAALMLGLAACTPIPGTGSEAAPAAEVKASAPEEQVSGAWGASREVANLPRLEFQEGGTLVGTDGCNGISGTYAVEGETIRLEQAASTLRACEGVDDWLRGGTEAKVGDGMLHVLNAKGTEIGQLERSE